jgi:hypothetical protein
MPAPGEAGIFGVLGYHAASFRQVLHGMTEQPRVRHAISIVSEEPDAGFEEFIEVG